MRAFHSSRSPLNLIKPLPQKPSKEQTTKGMVCVCRLILVAALLLCLQVQFSASQHWSHGWYPGGKRELDSYSSPEISGEIKLCEAGECSYLRPLRTNVLRNILLGALTKEFQKRK